MRSLTAICSHSCSKRSAWYLGAAGSIALSGLLAASVPALADPPFVPQTYFPATPMAQPTSAESDSASASDNAAISLIGHIGTASRAVPGRNEPNPAALNLPAALQPHGAAGAARDNGSNPLRVTPISERRPALTPIAPANAAPALGNPTASNIPAAKAASASRAAAKPAPRPAKPTAHRAANAKQPIEAVVPPVGAPGVAGVPLVRPAPIPGDDIPPGYPYFGPAGCGSCGPQWYVQGEALYFQRDEADRRLVTQNLRTGDFDFEQGARITVGRQFDCLEGVEFSVIQMNEWVTTTDIISPGGGLNSRFVSPAFGAVAFNDFTNAVRQTARYESQLNGFEINQRQFGWDVMSSMWGFRYINLDEDFVLRSQDLAGDVGANVIDTDNVLVGLQVGGDMAQPVTENLWVRGTTKVGGFANFQEHDSVFFNTQGPTIRASDDKVQFAFLTEMSVGASLQLTQNVAVRAGYEFWYLWGLALAPEQIDFTIGPQTGAFHDDNGSMFLHGPTAGLNIVW